MVNLKSEGRKKKPDTSKRSGSEEDCFSCSLLKVRGKQRQSRRVHEETGASTCCEHRS